jgi:hypothetical protein
MEKEERGKLEKEVKDGAREKFAEGKVRYWVSQERKVWHLAVAECHKMGGEIF